MKPIVKIISITLCIVMLAVTLCSCQFLDEKKANHAVYCDETKKSFSFRGHTYHKADISNDITLIAVPEMSDSFVTEKDVPVLLSSSFGEMLYYDNSEHNPVIIQCVSYYINEGFYNNSLLFNNSINNLYMDYNMNSSSDYNRIYIREDQYDAVSNILKKAVFDHYYMIEYDYNDEDIYDPDYEYMTDEEYTVIDDDSAKAIRESLKTGKRIKYSDFGNDEFDALDVYQCDKDVLFTNNYGVMLLRFKDQYYLTQQKDMTPISNDVVKVPDQYAVVFEKLFKEHENNITYDLSLIECFEAMSLEFYPDDTSSSSVEFI